MKKRLTLILLGLLMLSLGSFAQLRNNRNDAELFIEVPLRGRITVSLGNDQMSSSNSRFRFFEQSWGNTLLWISLNNRPIYQGTIELKPGLRIIAVLTEQNTIQIVKEIVLPLNSDDNLNNSFPGRPGVQQRPYRCLPEISKDTYEQLYKSVKNISFDDDRIAQIELVLPYASLSTMQLKELMNALSFSSGKLKLLKSCAGKTSDPQNSFMLLDCFQFSSDRDKATKIIRNAGIGLM